MSVAAKGKTAKGQGGSGRDSVFDRELADLPKELRWCEWMGRIEAVLFASASPVGRDDLVRLVGQGASVEMLIEDIQAELAGWPHELVEIPPLPRPTIAPPFSRGRGQVDVSDQNAICRGVHICC
jgi:hypothetical protein